MTKTRQHMGWLQTNTVRIARAHFVYVFLFALATIAYDAWNLITNQALMERWTVAVILLIFTTIIWLLARNTLLAVRAYQTLLCGLIIMDIAIAGFVVYAGRGTASRGVALFAIPIILSVFYNSRSILFATASISLGIYSYAVVRYFAEHPSEGYQVELYTDLGFYGASFFLLAAFLWIYIRSVQARSS